MGSLVDEASSSHPGRRGHVMDAGNAGDASRSALTLATSGKALELLTAAPKGIAQPTFLALPSSSFAPSPICSLSSKHCHPLLC